jgi:tetratricopeptide (TPR) repeat protein
MIFRFNNNFLVFLFLFFVQNNVFSQKEASWKELLIQSDKLLVDDPMASKKLALRAYKMSLDLHNEKDQAEAAAYLANSHFYLDELDSATILLESSVALSRKHNLQKRLSKSLSFLGQLNIYNGNRKQAHELLFEAEKIMEASKDSLNLPDIYIRISGLYMEEDNTNLGIEYALKCYEISKKQANVEYECYALNNMTVIHTKLGNSTKGISMANEAINLAKKSGLKFVEYEARNNLGILYKNNKEYKKALEQYQMAEVLSKDLNFERGEMGLLGNKGILLNLLKDYTSAIKAFAKALEIEKKLDVPMIAADIKINAGRSYAALGDYSKGMASLNEGFAIARELKSLELQEDAYLVEKEIFLRMGNIDLALESMEKYQMVHDSIFTLAKTRQINELQTQYETEKKDGVIKLLGQKHETNRWRIIGLILGLLLVAFVALGLFQKQKKDKVIYEKEKEIEAEKLMNAGKDLEAKRKELTAKVLQLAHKNEFLNSLKGEMEHLKNNVDDSVNKTSNRVSRMINRDIEGDTQWAQFSEEFSGIHQDFLRALTAKFGSFTKSEIRLISLLKMNMNSKEITGILGISDDGIRKSRYRLRKKMHLEETELQSFLLGFS